MTNWKEYKITKIKEKHPHEDPQSACTDISCGNYIVFSLDKDVKYKNGKKKYIKLHHVNPFSKYEEGDEIKIDNDKTIKRDSEKTIRYHDSIAFINSQAALEEAWENLFEVWIENDDLQEKNKKLNEDLKQWYNHSCPSGGYYISSNSYCNRCSSLGQIISGLKLEKENLERELKEKKQQLEREKKRNEILKEAIELPTK